MNINDIRDSLLLNKYHIERESSTSFKLKICNTNYDISYNLIDKYCEERSKNYSATVSNILFSELDGATKLTMYRHPTSINKISIPSLFLDYILFYKKYNVCIKENEDIQEINYNPIKYYKITNNYINLSIPTLDYQIDSVPFLQYIERFQQYFLDFHTILIKDQKYNLSKSMYDFLEENTDIIFASKIQKMDELKYNYKIEILNTDIFKNAKYPVIKRFKNSFNL